MATRTDNFNRADSSSSIGSPSDGGSGYVGSNGTGGIFSNQAYFPTSPSSYNSRVLDCGSADADTQVTVSTTASFNYFLLPLRYTDDNNFDMLFCEGTDCQFYKRISGTDTALGSAVSHTFANGDVVKASLSGTTYKIYINGSLASTQTLSSANNGTMFGIGTFGNVNILFDDLSITVASGGSVFAPYFYREHVAGGVV